MDNNRRENNNVTICINPEIRDYSEDMFWGLSLRQFIFSVIGCGISVGIYFLLRNFIGMEAVSWACVFGMFPCALLGFVKYNGMPAEKLLLAIIKSEVLTPKHLLYRPVNLLEEVLADKKSRKMDLHRKDKIKK